MWLGEGGGPAALGCRAVTGVTSQLGGWGTGSAAAAPYKADGLSPGWWDTEHLGVGGGHWGEVGWSRWRNVRDGPGTVAPRA